VKKRTIPKAAYREVGGVQPVKDDMIEHDSRGAPAYGTTLLTAIQRWPEPDSLLSLFAFHDKRAGSLLKFHRVSSLLAVSTGAGALVLGIALLGVRAVTGKDFAPTTAFAVELGLIAVVGLVVLIAATNDYRGHWLLARYNAEQLRLARWRLFSSPEHWDESESQLSEPILKEVEDVLVEDEKLLRSLAQRERAVELLPVTEVASRQASNAAHYYCSNRLDAQIAYFHRKASEGGKDLIDWPFLAPFFFVLSLVLVVVHLVLSGFGLFGGFDEHARRVLETWSLVLVTAAAIVPAIWAGVRTWRAANEVERTALRAEAKRHLLADYRKRLTRHGISPEETFATFALCEGIFAQEQGEWLRLMVEAEWY
jgi:hypothetical protein